MANKFLEFKDGVIVEIGAPSDQREEMHTANAERVDSTMEMVGAMIGKVVRPIGESFVDLHKALNVPIEVAEAEVEMGLSFSAEGNLFVAKSKAEGNLKVRIAFRPIKAAIDPTGSSS